MFYFDGEGGRREEFRALWFLVNRVIRLSWIIILSHYTFLVVSSLVKGIGWITHLPKHELMELGFFEAVGEFGNKLLRIGSLWVWFREM